jgi:transcription elongation factor GreA
MIIPMHRVPPRPLARWSSFWLEGCDFHICREPQEFSVMEFVSAQEKALMERQREELYKAQIDVQDRIRKAASLGDLSENAEYHFAKEENRSIQRQLAELEAKIKSVSVVSNEDVPKDLVFIGHTVKLLDLDDQSEQLVQLVGQAQPPAADTDVMPVSANSPMGQVLMKARVGDTIKVKAPRGTMEFKVLEIVQ